MKVARRTKLLYGLGFSAQGIKDGLFQVFLFFYFTQILGLDAALTGTATVIALLFDAVSDPLVGVISDGWKSKKWGRRHPFMFLSALPLGLSMWLLFLPPAGMGQMGLFLWMTVFTILLRLSLTLFIVPAMSLGAELSTDYEERTSITSYRIMFGAFMAMVTIFIGFAVFFVPTEEYARGLLNKEAYPKFALFCSILVVLLILLSTWGTKKEIPRLQAITVKEKKAFSFRKLWSKFKNMLELKSFNSVILYTMTLYIALGVGTVFTTYLMEYYFAFSENEMIILPIASGVGGILALIFAPKIAKILDKKATVALGTFIFSFSFSLPYNLRILGLFPENGDPLVIKVFFLSIVVGYIFLWTVLSLINSMIADVVDEYELKTKLENKTELGVESQKTDNRDEGLFFAALSFSYKMTVGGGYFIAGLLLKWIEFPNTTGVQASDSAIERLGMVAGPVLLTIYLASIFFILMYPISKERYQEIRAALDKKD